MTSDPAFRKSIEGQQASNNKQERAVILMHNVGSMS